MRLATRVSAAVLALMTFQSGYGISSALSKALRLDDTNKTSDQIKQEIDGIYKSYKASEKSDSKTAEQTTEEKKAAEEAAAKTEAEKKALIRDNGGEAIYNLVKDLAGEDKAKAKGIKDQVSDVLAKTFPAALSVGGERSTFDNEDAVKDFVNENFFKALKDGIEKGTLKEKDVRDAYRSLALALFYRDVPVMSVAEVKADVEKMNNLAKAVVSTEGYRISKGDLQAAQYNEVVGEFTVQDIGGNAAADDLTAGGANEASNAAVNGISEVKEIAAGPGAGAIADNAFATVANNANNPAAPQQEQGFRATDAGFNGAKFIVTGEDVAATDVRSLVRRYQNGAIVVRANGVVAAANPVTTRAAARGNGTVACSRELRNVLAHEDINNLRAGDLGLWLSDGDFENLASDVQRVLDMSRVDIINEMGEQAAKDGFVGAGYNAANASGQVTINVENYRVEKIHKLISESAKKAYEDAVKAAANGNDNVALAIRNVVDGQIRVNGAGAAGQAPDNNNVAHVAVGANGVYTYTLQDAFVTAVRNGLKAMWANKVVRNMDEASVKGYLGVDLKAGNSGFVSRFLDALKAERDKLPEGNNLLVQDVSNKLDSLLGTSVAGVLKADSKVAVDAGIIAVRDGIEPALKAALAQNNTLTDEQAQDVVYNLIGGRGLWEFLDNPAKVAEQLNEIKKVSDNAKKSDASASSTSTDSSKAAVTLSSGVKLTDADVAELKKILGLK